MTLEVVFRGFSFRYPDRDEPVFEGVSLTVPEGAFALVAGATGSGKSTLLRAVNGLVPHFSGGELSGRVIVGGRDTRTHAPRRMADLVAFVPQDPGASFVVDRVEDELAYAMENLARPAASMRRSVEEALDLLGIEALRARSVRTLSGGERQRVAIAAALTPGARIVVLDEPTSQLDPQGAEDVLAALQRLVHDHGLTVILAEHRFERVAGFVDLAIGCAGHGAFCGAPGDVLDRLDMGPPVARLARIFGWTPTPLTVRDARRRVAAAGPGLVPGPRSAARPPAGAPVLDARALTGGYGDRRVIDGLDVAVAPGEVVGLVGRNGAGKTTLLRMLAGLHPPASGEVLVGGRAPHPGRDVALCPQVSEMVLFKDTVAGEVQASVGRDGAADVWLDRLGIAHLGTRHPRDLSAGQRVLVAVAAIGATGAPVLLLDEPTRGLDASSKDGLGAFLARFATDGGAAVVATHDVELVAEIATRVIMLAGGEVIADGSPQDVLGDSPVFAPQTTRVLGRGWLTPGQVAVAAAR
ncbi:MAG: ABC transporter ATP-binding protein [Actinomycetota bacterium]